MPVLLLIFAKVVNWSFDVFVPQSPAFRWSALVHSPRRTHSIRRNRKISDSQRVLNQSAPRWKRSSPLGLMKAGRKSGGQANYNFKSDPPSVHLTERQSHHRKVNASFGKKGSRSGDNAFNERKEKHVFHNLCLTQRIIRMCINRKKHYTPRYTEQKKPNCKIANHPVGRKAFGNR